MCQLHLLEGKYVAFRVWWLLVGWVPDATWGGKMIVLLVSRGEALQPKWNGDGLHCYFVENISPDFTGTLPAAYLNWYY